MLKVGKDQIILNVLLITKLFYSIHTYICYFMEWNVYKLPVLHCLIFYIWSIGINLSAIHYQSFGSRNRLYPFSKKVQTSLFFNSLTLHEINVNH